MMLDAITGLLEREVIVALITELFIATDRKDWPSVTRVFSPEVQLDMSAVGAGPEQRVSREAIAASWETGLAPIEQIHHQIGNFVVHLHGPKAQVHCYGIAYHFRPRRDGRNTRTFVGTYDFELDQFETGWAITAMRFNLKFIDGNPALEAPEAPAGP
jgi:hypothetical protein